MLTKTLVAALLIISITCRSHNHKDAFRKCMMEECQDQYLACIDEPQCFPTIKRCLDEYSHNIDELNECLSDYDEAYDLTYCLADNCANDASTALLKLHINDMN